MQSSRMTTIAAVLTVSAATASCAANPRPAPTPSGPAIERVRSLTLYGKPFELHLLTPAARAQSPALVVYASGDGGWFGAAVDMFHTIGRAGYYTVGISSRVLMKIDRPKGARLDLPHLINEYQQIVQTARAEFGLAPEAGAVLTGWSRGAAFAVLAASEWPASSPPLQGVVAIGLSDGEDFGLNDHGDDTDDGAAIPNVSHWPFEPYQRLKSLDMQCAVIQSTGDQYLTAARAQALFGPNTPSRRFYSIDASNHRFSGGKPAFDRALLDAVAWTTQEN